MRSLGLILHWGVFLQARGRMIQNEEKINQGRGAGCNLYCGACDQQSCDKQVTDDDVVDMGRPSLPRISFLFMRRRSIRFWVCPGDGSYSHEGYDHAAERRRHA